jgi:VanZ family protein
MFDPGIYQPEFNVVGYSGHDYQYSWIRTLWILLLHPALQGARRGRAFSFAAAIVESSIVSLAIELAQVFLPTRTSSLRDLICNISGSVVGIILAIKSKNATNCGN